MLFFSSLLPILTLSSKKNTHNNDDGSDDDDDAGWITPDNIGQIKRVETKTANIDELVKRKKVGVACITTDYAMQNILIQVRCCFMQY